MEARVWEHFKDVVGDCSFATHLSDEHLDDYRKSSEREDAVTTVVAHTTGATWLEKQLRDAGKLSQEETYEKCLQWILKYYWTKGTRPTGSTSAHYLIWWDGRIFQLSDDHLRVPHVGVSADERRAYLDGSWRTGGRADGQKGVDKGKVGPISQRAISEWDAAWPHYKSPQHLFPTKFINDCSVGVEMPPCVVGGKALDEPLGPTLRFTREQHTSFCMLVLDVAQRWNWQGEWLVDPKGGPWSPRVAGHSDFDLFGRSTSAAGMWDPGGHRNPPWWDWVFVYRTLHVMRIMQTLNPVVTGIRQIFDQFRTVLPFKGDIEKALMLVGGA